MPVGFLTNDFLCASAMDFLREYHPDDTIPVPIEEIVEFQLELDIVPLPDLKRNFDIDGALSGDFSAIFVDDFVQSSRPNRYRFTLAHEVGHLVLHKDYLETLGPFEDIGQWKGCLNGMDGKVRDCMEYHGYTFAGYVLVPKHHLEPEFLAIVHEVNGLIAQAKSSGLTRPDYLSYAIEHLANSLAETFQVSPQTIIKRIRADKLDDHIS